ncbi:hypothetical protein CDV55_105311 [Aspergillus turcosus]|uniref:Uncharacterized protein n=1 Tax=Aspergillus turcosus TaxID=1245748 RepID=A0A229X9L0_9EURO|nr:hypothetical protein CDV55_105311 [Aspergillus turcosus]RLL97669.1 hypothetical protein CFD26_106137 [Aspergillus turcosus]
MRLRIYRKTGLVVDFELDLSTGQAVGEWSSREQRLFPKPGSRPGWQQGPWFPNQLFFVSRSVSEDARRTFYSENHFCFEDDMGCGLRSLSNMGRIGWGSLRRFAIRIGAEYCQGPQKQACHGTAEEVLENDSQLEKNGVLGMWRQICHQLATHITQDDQLEIRLICGAATKKTLAAFLEPLQQLPRLRELSIRVGPCRNLDLQQALMATIAQKTKFLIRQARPGVFRFLDLPVELQVRILEFTELVAPQPLILRSWYKRYKRFLPHDCWWGACNARPHPYIIDQGCWCPATHTAFSTAHPCWQLPDTRYLVSKSMRELALSVYYSKNTFEVWYDPSDSPDTAAWTPQTSGFLRGFPEYSWKDLRRVHWIFPSDLDEDAFRPMDKEPADWTKTMKVISQSFNLANFILELSLSPSDIRTWKPEQPEKVERRLGLYDRIVEPVRQLNGLVKDFFVHNYFPLHESQDETRLSQERILECRVMGSDYDSMARGKKYTEVFEDHDYD